MKYKFIHFEEADQKTKRDFKIDWKCHNNKSGDVLGFVFWYAPWKQYCFTQAEQGVMFNSSCLDDVSDFLGKQTNARKERKNAKD